MTTEETTIKSRMAKVFDQETSQEQIFHHFLPLISKFLEGNNCSIMGYGNTGSGKTHTMFGEHWPFLITKYIECKLSNSPSAWTSTIEHKAGLILRMAEEIFARLPTELFSKVSISVKYYQIYNERIYDLLGV